MSDTTDETPTAEATCSCGSDCRCGCQQGNPCRCGGTRENTR